MRISLLVINVLIIMLSHSAFSQTKAEWQENCMTPLTEIRGWHYKEIKKVVKIKISATDLKCEYDYQNFFGGEGQTYVRSVIETPILMGQLSAVNIVYERYFAGKVERSEACQKIEELRQMSAANSGLLEADATIKRFRQDWIKPGNTDVNYLEEIDLKFANGLILEGGAKLNLDGELCQYDKKP